MKAHPYRDPTSRIPTKSDDLLRSIFEGYLREMNEIADLCDAHGSASGQVTLLGVIAYFHSRGLTDKQDVRRLAQIWFMDRYPVYKTAYEKQEKTE